MKRDYTMITLEEEHGFQCCSKARAEALAKLETIRTHRKHQAFLTTTYRNLQSRLTWAVALELCWKNGKLVTKGN